MTTKPDIMRKVNVGIDGIKNILRLNSLVGMRDQSLKNLGFFITKNGLRDIQSIKRIFTLNMEKNITGKILEDTLKQENVTTTKKSELTWIL